VASGSVRQLPQGASIQTGAMARYEGPRSNEAEEDK